MAPKKSSDKKVKDRFGAMDTVKFNANRVAGQYQRAESAVSSSSTAAKSPKGGAKSPSKSGAAKSPKSPKTANTKRGRDDGSEIERTPWAKSPRGNAKKAKATGDEETPMQQRDVAEDLSRVKQRKKIKREKVTYRADQALPSLDSRLTCLPCPIRVQFADGGSKLGADCLVCAEVFPPIASGWHSGHKHKSEALEKYAEHAKMCMKHFGVPDEYTWDAWLGDSEMKWIYQLGACSSVKPGEKVPTDFKRNASSFHEKYMNLYENQTPKIHPLRDSRLRLQPTQPSAKCGSGGAGAAGPSRPTRASPPAYHPLAT